MQCTLRKREGHDLTPRLLVGAVAMELMVVLA